MATSAIVLVRDDWETDAIVVDQHARLATQLLGRQGETEEHQNNRAIEGTTRARGAYIERLRYTIKAYGRNMDELAGRIPCPLQVRRQRRNRHDFWISVISSWPAHSSRMPMRNT